METPQAEVFALVGNRRTAAESLPPQAPRAIACSYGGQCRLLCEA